MPEYLASETPNNPKIIDNPIETNINSIDNRNLVAVEDETLIRLLEEQLTVKISKQKIGEVVVRKVIETEIIQVPIRREKLIIEQISPEQKQLAEIDLSQGEISDLLLSESAETENTGWDSSLTVSGSFHSPKIASLLLNAIALEREPGCRQVRVSIVVEDEEHQKKYQEWFNQCSHGKLPKSEKPSM